MPVRPKGRQRDISREKKKKEARNEARRDVSLADVPGLGPGLDPPRSPRSARAEHDAALFNECKLPTLGSRSALNRDL